MYRRTNAHLYDDGDQQEEEEAQNQFFLKQKGRPQLPSACKT
jgi:hypothetical protein